ncbi:MAG: hypothetical protein ACJ788_12185 [Ktedonobacteraceae bacterium]
MIKTVSLKTAVATAVYYLAILALVAFLGVVVVKLVVWPPCSITTRNACVVDGWSITGLAGAVLGVGATLLAILGAVAVAYWWANLNEKVDQRVDEQIKTAIDQALQEQKKNLTEQTAHLLKEQEEKFKVTDSKLQIEMNTLKEQASTIEKRVQTAKKDLIKAMMQLDPWMIEAWASDEMFLDPRSEVGVYMVRKYLQYVDAFFPSDSNSTLAITKYGAYLNKISAPYVTPIEYWEQALAWQQKIEPQYHLSLLTKAIEREIEQRRPNIESWKKGHGIT